jgi:hypothetical protein
VYVVFQLHLQIEEELIGGSNAYEHTLDLDLPVKH